MPTINKISGQKWTTWYSQNCTQAERGTQRLGQKFCNDFDFTGPDYADLFYQVNNRLAMKIIVDQFIDFGD